MSARNQDILFGIDGQKLVFDAPEGRPSSVTSVTVYENTEGDDGTTEGATSGNPSVESDPDTTLDDAAGSGQSSARTIPLTATTGIEVGRPYLLTGANGEEEWPEVVAVESGVSATARKPLYNAYQSGATFQSTRIQVDVALAWASDENNLSESLAPQPKYRVRWVYVVDGKTCVHDAYADLVRYAGDHSVVSADIEGRVPGFMDHVLPTFHRVDGGRRLLSTAYREVKTDLYGLDRDDAKARDAELVDDLVVLKFVALGLEAQFYVSRTDETREAMEVAYNRYQARLDALVRLSQKLHFATDETGGARRVPAQPITRR